MTDIEDPFALPEVARVTPRMDVLSRGRYMLPNRDGSHKSRGFMRVSNLVSAYSDQFGLRMWEIGEVLKGLEIEPALYGALLDAHPAAMSKEDLKAWAAEFIEHAKEASGGNVGSKHGNQRHAAVEAEHAGLPTGHLDAGTRRHLSLYRDCLARNQLVALPGMQERIVLVEELEVCGRLDNIVRDDRNGLLYVGDLKTQKQFWTWLEIGAQFACYAHGDAMWESDLDGGGRWVTMPPVGRDLGMVLWMPRDSWDVSVYEVDLVKGWATARRAYEVVKDRAEAKSVGGRRGWLRAAPPATVTEQYAARFAAVETLAEGRALVAECREAGVWGTVLAECAENARRRIAIPA